MDGGMMPIDEDLFADCGLDDFIQQPEPTVPFVGLWNLGNSCFFNSVLQILFYCPGFQKQLGRCKRKLQTELEDDYSAMSTQDEAGNDPKEKRKYKLLLELCKLFGDMRENQRTLISPEGQMNLECVKAVRPCNLMDTLREVYPAFEPYTQQDAQECLRCMLDILHEALAMLIGGNNPKNKKQKSMVSDQSCKMFGGRKSGETCLLSNSEGKSQSENQDPALPVFKESRTTAARKRGVRNVLKNFSRPKVQKAELKNYRPLVPLGENKSCEKMTAGEAAALLTQSPEKKLEYSDPTSTLLPPIKKKKLNTGIPRFYKPPAFSPIRHQSKSTEFESHITQKLTKNPFKVALKPPAKYKKLAIATSPRHNEHEDNFVQNCHKQPLTNFVEELFQGQLINEVRCMECENRVQRVEDFMDISIPVKETEKESCTTIKTENCNEFDNMEEPTVALPTCKKNDDGRQTPCSVTWGLSSFTSHEFLEGENKYYCGKCHRYAEGERRLLLHKLPPVLTLHLKRFSSSKDASLLFGNNVSKINSSLNVPLQLSLNRWCSESGSGEFKYTLFGIIVHSGITICSGHYLAYLRLRNSWTMLGDDQEKLEQYDGKWLEADDDRTRILSEEEMGDIISPKESEGTSRTPYLLFYYREMAT